ncbi:MAG: L,D-transpeptidase [Spirochaetes bacterium]|nr:L,D-transpeptidase [Spirochaetota bacterium]
MRRIFTISTILFLTVISLILLVNKSSYSFIKEFFIRNNIKEKNVITIEKNIDDIEDLVFIPKIKDFKKYFLKKINTSLLVKVKIPENVLYLYGYNEKKDEYTLLKQYPVAVGKPHTKTPAGEGIIYTKGPVKFKYKFGTNTGGTIKFGHDRDGKKFQIPYDQMFGLFMTVNQSDAYVIHSTTEDWKIGEAVSGGCVRMLIPDMLDLYRYIKTPIKVMIEYSLFTLDKDLLTIYPDIYREHTSLYSALLEFLNDHDIPPIIFDNEKLKNTVTRDLPATISLNEILHKYFTERSISFNRIKLEYGDLLKERKITRINELFLHYKK